MDKSKNKNKLEGEFILKPTSTPPVPEVKPTPIPSDHSPSHPSSPHHTRPATPQAPAQTPPAEQIETIQQELMGIDPEFGKPRTPHLFSYFCPYPQNFTFQNQEHDENVILLIRRHFIVNVGWIITSIIFLLLPIFIFPLIPLVLPFLSLSAGTYLAITLFYYLLIVGFILVKFSLWYFHIGVITNKRIVDVDVVNILFRHIAEAGLGAVVDLSYTQGGAFQSVFNYGNIFIQTEARIANIEFDQAPRPAEIVKIISKLIGNRPKND